MSTACGGLFSLPESTIETMCSDDAIRLDSYVSELLLPERFPKEKKGL
jgi:hypothetical protein